LKKEISEFSEALRGNDGPGLGQISLEFFQKKKNRWPFQAECIPWEVWTVRLELIKLNNEHGKELTSLEEWLLQLNRFICST
jgi:autophagy-related protein 101